MKKELKRRTFIRTAVTGGIGLGVAIDTQAFNILSAYPVQDKYRVAIMGLNGRGIDHARGFALQEKAEVAYICDVDSRAIARGIDAVGKTGQASAPKGIDDFRRALDDRSVDALTIAAPDHWHAPAAILALKAGKHVYLEKPGSHNPAEAELLVLAAKKYGKVIQLGNQRRSWPRVVEAIQALHNGIIGRVYYARTWYTNTRPAIGKGIATAVPSWLNYDLWQGPAPRKPFLDNIVHYDWHWRWHWGTGELLNNGTHYIDVARWGLQVNYPVKVFSTGGRYQHNDDWETPDTQIATFDFAEGKTVAWEGRSCNQRSINDMGSGISFHGEQGTMEIRHNAYRVYNNDGEVVRSIEPESDTLITQTGPGFDLDRAHFADFLDCLGSGKTPNSDFAECYKSVLLCQLGNISYRTGRALQCDASNGHIRNDAEAMKLWSREYEKGWEPTL